MRVSGRTQLLGLVGWPLEASLSFALQNAALESLGLDWLYLPLPVPPGRLERAFAGLAVCGFRGWNVTVPHKEEAARRVDALSAEAQRLGAVNTVRVDGQRLEGHNTDAEGLRRALAGAHLQGEEALVLGAGGAAAAVVAVLRERGLRVRVANRSPDRARALAARLGVEAVPWEEAAAASAGAALLTNATSSPDPLPGLSTGPRTLALDLHYHPTPFLARAARGMDGLEMLVGQAAESLRIWTGQEPPLEAMRRAALAERERQAAAAEAGR